MGGGKGALSGRTGESSTRLIDNAASAEESRPRRKEPVVGDRDLSQNCPSVAEASGWNRRPWRRRPRQSAFKIKRICAARETGCLRCKKPRLRLGTTGIEVQVPLDVTQKERFDDALGLMSQVHR